MLIQLIVSVVLLLLIFCIIDHIINQVAAFLLFLLLFEYSLLSSIRSISEISSCFFGPRSWHIEIRHRVKKASTINLPGFETLKLKIRRSKLWKPTVCMCVCMHVCMYVYYYCCYYLYIHYYHQ